LVANNKAKFNNDLDDGLYLFIGEMSHIDAHRAATKDKNFYYSYVDRGIGGSFWGSMVGQLGDTDPKQSID
jgi:hypothetical protein